MPTPPANLNPQLTHTMSKKSKKLAISLPPIQTVDGLRIVVNALVERQTRLERKKAALALRIAQLNTEFDEENAENVAHIEAMTAAAHLYCDGHRDIFPEDRKSMEFGNATIGFRKNPPKVDKVVNKDTFEAIAKRLLTVPWGAPFVRTGEPEVNKESLLSEQANLDEAALRAVGIKITQGETFFIEPTQGIVEATRLPTPEEQAA